MNTVLVTGGAGFLGSHLCDALIADGSRVICLDDLSTGSLANLRHLESESRFDFVQGDVTVQRDLKVDRIYNLACPASPVHYQADPVRTMRTCFLGAMNMLELARESGARVVQASTSEVYGDPEVHPQHETYWGNVNAVGECSCYDEGKRAAETLFHDYRRHRGVDAKIVRIFNTYGPRMQPDDGRVVSNFIVQALAGRPLTIYGDGRQTRSFCYVDDLVDALVRMMAADAFAGPVNIGNPQEFTVLELAAKVVDLTGSSSSITRLPLPPDDPRQRRPDIRLAREKLGWEPKTDLDAGLRRTVEEFGARRSLTGA